MRAVEEHTPLSLSHCCCPSPPTAHLEVRPGGVEEGLLLALVAAACSAPRDLLAARAG